MVDVSSPAKPLSLRSRSRLEGLLVLGTVIAFTSVLVLSVLTVPAHFSATVGATRSTQNFRANDRITFQWQTTSGQATTFTLTNSYQNVSMEDGVGSPSKVVYQATANSGSFAFIADGAPYVFSCACGSGSSLSTTIHVSGTIANPIL